MDHTTLAELLERQARLQPGAIAITAPGRAPSSYRMLWEHVQAAGAALRAAGIGAADSVALALDNGPEMAATLLAVASHSVSAPLNPRYRAPEFDFYLHDLKAKALVVAAGDDSPAVEVAAARGIRVLRVKADPDAAAGTFELTTDGRLHAGASSAGLPCASDTALVLHTSGTTSRPKIVPLSQANLCASARNVAATLALSPQDTCLNIMPLFHIHGIVAALLASLHAGGCVVCTPGFSAERFTDWVDELCPSWYTAVPTMHQAILSTLRDDPNALSSAAPFRLIRSSSASLPPAVMRELEQVFGAPVVEAYGMTEAAHQMCSNPLPPAARKPGSVGISQGPDVSIMGGDGRLLPQGEVGEVVIRGENVMSGYVVPVDDVAAASGNVHVEHASIDGDNGTSGGKVSAHTAAFENGWFRTGDQGYFDADGYLFLTGRLKEIINRGGETIAPREIDEALLSHPGVRQAVAFGVPHAALGEEVAAAVVLASQSSPTETELREFLLERLSSFKTPKRLIFVDDIPKGPTGKLQRIGLAERLGITDASDGASSFVPPGTPTETLLAGLWKDALGIDSVGRNDHFFELGGDSIRAARILARLQQTGFEAAPIRLFFVTPKLHEFAAALDELGQSTGEARPDASDAVVIGGEIEALASELEQLSPDELERLLGGDQLDAGDQSEVRTV